MWWNARRTASVPDRIAVAAAMALGVSAALALAACSKSTAPASGPIALWVANSGSTRTGSSNTSPNPNSILGFTASQIATGTTLPPAVVITTNDGNAGIALDANGNLWAANPFDNSIAEYSASQITKTGTPKPNVLISATPVGSLNQPAALAFDPHGKEDPAPARCQLVECPLQRFDLLTGFKGSQGIRQFIDKAEHGVEVGQVHRSPGAAEVHPGNVGGNRQQILLRTSNDSNTRRPLNTPLCTSVASASSASSAGSSMRPTPTSPQA